MSVQPSSSRGSRGSVSLRRSGYGLRTIVAAAAVVTLCWATSAPASAQNAPLVGNAWSLADEAYRAFDSRDYARAIDTARQAIELRPDLPQLRRLLINSLAAAGDLTGALEQADKAVADKASDAELETLRQSLKTQIAAGQQSGRTQAAYKAAEEGYRAYARRNYRAALAAAKSAIAQDPSRPNYYALRIDALQGLGRLEEAEREATAALARFPHEASLQLQRGYLRQRLHRPGAAGADFKAVVDARSLTAEQRRNARLSLVDVLLAEKRPREALTALAPLSPARGYDFAIRQGYAYQALGRQEDALRAFDVARRHATRGPQRAAAIRGGVGALVALGRKEEASTRFKQAYEAGELADTSSVDLAYLAQQVDDRPLAFLLFQQADTKGQLRGRALLDAGYLARSQFDNAAAINYFRRAIDANDRGEINLDRQRLFEVRRDVATVSRTWGATAALIFGSIGVVPGLPVSFPSVGRTLQLGEEFYWRPPGIGFRDGATFELFGRAFTTLYDATGGPTGSNTTQGAFGARWKPITDINLVLEVGRMLKIGEYARNDWQFRVAYSANEGGDLRWDVNHWRYWQVYSEINGFAQAHQILASAEARYGHSFRLDAISPNVVLSPFVAVGAAYDTTLATRQAVGAGPGLNLRAWFREDHYTAPMSYLDLNVQYRLRINGDRRAEGWFSSLSLVY
ncbi:bacteriophage N4 adsorption protein A [Pseudolabrys taiwanensis]|uniref:bacteriophage N4 adsorption protein A n=1 Tax=Pseudolabrys taiwanensis TaxID=331696 RepID=UPI0013B3F450|nr:bacteriophage N4 adsorption protein A [Pseudolabrys taiwanensis]